MRFSAGHRLGVYELVSPLGAGGMGEVYRARDTRLDRAVAIKVLNAVVAESPDFAQRFEREARTVSQLQHPHICTLFDIGRESGTEYLVIEFLEGETLADRLTKGALPLDQLLKIAIQIADALDHAHRAGIVHRDLKPGNVMLTKSGAKLLDFGLAKPRPVGPAPGMGTAPLLSAAPTMTGPSPSPLTTAGSVIGTIQYMAPRLLVNADGVPLDWSTDDRFLVYGGWGTLTQAGIWVLPLTGDSKPRRVVEEGRAGRLSPDGRWLAYSSARSGAEQVYVCSFPDRRSEWQVTSGGGGLFPVWSGDGRRLYYSTIASQIAVVDVTIREDAMNFGAPRTLFPAGMFKLGIPAGRYDVSRDGTRIALLTLIEPQQVQVTLAINWDARLSRE